MDYVLMVITIFLISANDSFGQDDDSPAEPGLCSNRSASETAFTKSFIYIPGEFLIAAVFPFHYPLRGFLQCNSSLARDRWVKASEALVYAVNTFNSEYQDEPLSGRLGALILDSCNDGILSSYTIADIHSGRVQLQNDDGEIVDPKKIIAYFGGYYSQTNVETSGIIGELHLTQLGYGSTSVQLFDYSNFLRTIPADDMTAQVIVRVAKDMQWKQIAVIYQNDAFGKAGNEAMLEHTVTANICVQLSLMVPTKLSESEAIDALYDVVSQANIQKVVLFVGKEEAQTLFRVVHEHNALHNRFYWILWSHVVLENATYASEALGAISVEPHVPVDSGLSSYFAHLVPSSTPDEVLLADPQAVRNTWNPFFDQWWEEHFECRLPNSERTAEPDCDESLSLIDGVHVAIDPFEELCSPAALAMAKGLGDALSKDSLCGGEITNCDNIRTPTGLTKIVNRTRNVRLVRPQVPGLTRVFTDRGDGNLEFVVHTLHVDDATYHYEQIGLFSPTDQLTTVKTYDEHNQDVCQSMLDGGLPLWIPILTVCGSVIIIIFVVCLILWRLGYISVSKAKNTHDANSKYQTETGLESVGTSVSPAGTTSTGGFHQNNGRDISGSQPSIGSIDGKPDNPTQARPKSPLPERVHRCVPGARVERFIFPHNAATHNVHPPDDDHNHSGHSGPYENDNILSGPSPGTSSFSIQHPDQHPYLRKSGSGGYADMIG